MHELCQNTAQRPYVSWFVVHLSKNNLWRTVVPRLNVTGHVSLPLPGWVIAKVSHHLLVDLRIILFEEINPGMPLFVNRLLLYLYRYGSGSTKVNDLDFEVIIDQYVRGLQVPMDDISRVDELYSAQQVVEDLNYWLIVQECSVLLYFVEIRFQILFFFFVVCHYQESMLDLWDRCGNRAYTSPCRLKARKVWEAGGILSLAFIR